MQSRASSFNKGIYLFNLKRFWLIAFAFAFLLTLIILQFLNNIHDRVWGRYATISLLDAARQVFGFSRIIVIFMFSIFSLIAALAVFSYIHYQRNTAMIHSLPITRNSLFTTHYLSGLTLVMLPLLVSGAILIIGELVMGITHIGDSLLWILVSAIILLLQYSFAVFVGMFTGHMAAHALYFFIFNFLAVFLEEVTDTVLSSLLFGYSRQHGLLTPLSPIAYLENLLSDFLYGRGNYVVLACYFLAGLLFAWGARSIYRRRHMETAGDVVSLKIMKPVFKYSVAFCSSALLGNIIVNLMNFGRGFSVFLASYLIGGFIGYFAAEMLLKKTVRVFKNVKGFLVFSLVIAALLCGIHFDLFGYETYVPDPGDIEVMYVDSYIDLAAKVALKPESYNPDQHRYIFMDSEMMDNPPAKLDEEMIRQLRQMPGIIERPETIEKAVALHRVIANNAWALDNENWAEAGYINDESLGVRAFSLSIAYRLKNGRVVERSYYLPYVEGSGGDLETRLLDLLSSDEFMEKAYPILNVEADDMNFIQVMFIGTDDTVLSLTSAEDIEDFLAVYKQDIRDTDPFDFLVKYGDANPTSIEIMFSFKKDMVPFVQYGGLKRLAGKTWSIQLWSNYRHTLEYLARKSAIDQGLWLEMVK